MGDKGDQAAPSGEGTSGRIDRPLVDVRGWEWVGGALPLQGEYWPDDQPRGGEPGLEEPSRAAVDDALRRLPWVMPSRRHVFVSDPQADGGALLRSLVASGAIEKTGPDDSDFEFTEHGSDAVFVIAGNVFGRGPSSLRVLRILHDLREREADLQLIGGQHDLRTLLGLRFLGSKEPRTGHLFVRMVRFVVPVLRELWDRELRHETPELLSDQDARELMLPPQDWAERFAAAVPELDAEQARQEIERINGKAAQLDELLAAQGMSPAMAYAAATRLRHAMLDHDGAYGWFSRSLRPCLRAGSLLFVHAGVDDRLAEMFANGGEQALGRAYQRLWSSDPLALYYGPFGNSVRTRYRSIDAALTERGVRALHSCGVYAVMHGHEAVPEAPLMQLRSGLLHFRCGALLDANTRAAAGLRSPGAAVTLVIEGKILGICSERLFVRVFDPSRHCRVVAIVDDSEGAAPEDVELG